MNTFQFEELPYEIQLKIFQSLRIKDIGRLAVISSTFRSLCYEESLFKHLYYREFDGIVQENDKKSWRERVIFLCTQKKELNILQIIIWAAKNGYPAVISNMFKTSRLFITDDSTVRLKLESNYLTPHDIINPQGTILHNAVHFGQPRVCEAILRIDKNNSKLFKTYNSFSATPLTTAAFYQQQACIEVLLKSGAEIEGREIKFSQTPLIVAASTGNVAVVELLLKYKANPIAKDADGYTAMKIARMKGFNNIVQILQKAIVLFTNEEK